MSKYEDLKYLKHTKARVAHACSNCNSAINKGDMYYSEKLRDIFLHSLHEKKFCVGCYEKFGNDLLKTKKNNWKIEDRSEGATIRQAQGMLLEIRPGTQRRGALKMQTLLQFKEGENGWVNNSCNSWCGCMVTADIYVAL